jgi:hypothetical protein
VPPAEGDTIRLHEFGTFDGLFRVKRMLPEVRIENGVIVSLTTSCELVPADV